MAESSVCQELPVSPVKRATALPYPQERQRRSFFLRSESFPSSRSYPL